MKSTSSSSRFARAAVVAAALLSFAAAQPTSAASASPAPEAAACSEQLRAGQPFRSGENVIINTTYFPCGNWSKVCTDLWYFHVLPLGGEWVYLSKACSTPKGQYSTTFAVVGKAPYAKIQGTAGAFDHSGRQVRTHGSPIVAV